MGLLADAGSGLAARRHDRLERALARVALERPGGHDREAGEHAARRGRRAGARVAGDLHHDTGLPPPVDDLAVPVDLEPVEQRVGDDAAHAVDRGQLLAARGADGVERAEPARQRARRDRADVADAECHEDAPQVLGLRLVEVLEQHLGGLRRHAVLVAPRRGRIEDAVALRGPLAAERRHALGLARLLVDLHHPGLGVADDHGDGHEVGHRELEQAGLGLERRILRLERLGERGRRDLAQALDVERAARRHVLDAAAHLRRAAARVRAAEVDVALLGGAQRRLALGAERGHDELALRAVA